MNIDTETVRRMRDALVKGGRLPAESATAGRVGNPSNRGKQAALERVAPFVETMYLTMMADGRREEPEQAAIRGALRVLTQDLLDESALDNLLQDCEQKIQAQGPEARLQSIGSYICADRQDREAAFTLAAAVALADDRVEAEESRLLASIAEWFGVSGKRSQEILGQFDGAA